MYYLTNYIKHTQLTTNLFQEASVLRRKVEEMEQDRDSLKKQVKELTDKIASQPKTNSTVTLRRTTNNKTNNLAEEKVKVRNQ